MNDSLSNHLRARPTVSWPTVLAALLAAFVLASRVEWQAPFLLVGVAGVVAIAHAPRWALYALLALVFALQAWATVCVLSEGPHDLRSDRDEAVEVAAAAFVEGRNPWSEKTPLDGPISAGPTSVLLAAPFVALRGGVQELSFLFWIAVLGLVVHGDLKTRNDRFPMLILLLMTGYFGVQHTMVYGLDELYYGYLGVAGAWLALERERPVVAGVCLAAALLVRPSYAFPALALVAWHAYGPRCTPRSLARIAVGALATGLVLLAPFAWIAGSDLGRHNPWLHAGTMLGVTWPETNPAFRFASAVATAMGRGPAGALKLALGVAVLLWIARGLRRHGLPHPFWHVCCGGFVASLLVYSDTIYNDYLPFFVIPGFFALAHDAAHSNPVLDPAERAA